RLLHPGLRHRGPGCRRSSRHDLPGPHADPTLRAAQMTDTTIQTGHARVAGGQTASGLSVQPWVMDAYAPGGAGVSTAQDLTRLATALLDGSAPGMEALTPTTASDQSNTRIGDFWRVSDWQ